MLIIELEGRAEKQKHGPAPSFLGDFPHSHPSPFLSPSSPVFLYPPLFVFREPTGKDVNLTSMGNILKEGSPINTISDKNPCSTFKMLLSSHSIFSFPYLLASNSMKHLWILLSSFDFWVFSMCCLVFPCCLFCVGN